jgi:hypothetical protein
MNERVKCAVKDCPNHSNEGAMKGPLCYPCFNLVQKFPLRAITEAVLEYREARQKLLEILESVEESCLE